LRRTAEEIQNPEAPDQECGDKAEKQHVGRSYLASSLIGSDGSAEAISPENEKAAQC
jgi:hypothetical protein